MSGEVSTGERANNANNRQPRQAEHTLRSRLDARVGVITRAPSILYEVSRPRGQLGAARLSDFDTCVHVPELRVVCAKRLALRLRFSNPSVASPAGLLKGCARLPVRLGQAARRVDQTLSPLTPRASRPSPLTPQSSAPNGARRTTRSAKPPTSRARRSRTTTARYPTEPAKDYKQDTLPRPAQSPFLSLSLPSLK